MNSGSYGPREKIRERRMMSADAVEGMPDAALDGAPGSLRGDAGPSRSAAEPHRARELAAQELELRARTLGAPAVGVRFGFGELFLELCGAFAITLARGVVDELASVAAID
jgi:hypothetical protein